MQTIISLKGIKMFAPVVLIAGIAMIAYLALADVSGSLLPVSDGNYLQWMPKTGSTHYTMVDESACNGTTDYNSTNTVGNRDSYRVSLSSIPNGSTITAIEITPCASKNKTGGGSATMDVFYRLNGGDSSDTGNYALSGTTPVDLTATSFTGLSVVKGLGTTLEVGAVLSAGTKGARLSRIAIVVTYTPAPPPPPTVTTNSATNVTSSSATLNGSANPNGGLTTGWFRYSSTNPGSCDDTFGTRAPFSGGTDLGSGTSDVAYSRSIFSLSPNTTYYYCAIASNSGGTGLGSIVSFTTPQAPPSAPSNLSGTASGSDVVLNWSDNSLNEDGFNVWRSTDGLNFSSVASTTASIITYTDVGLGAGTWYHKVRAFNGAGYSGFSNTATTTIP